MAAQATSAGRGAGVLGEMFGVKTPGTLLLFFLSSLLSFSLIFQSEPEATAVLSAHGWGYGPHFWQWQLWGLWFNHFLHTSLWHFACNAYWFLIFGPALEEILGTRRYLLQTAVAAFAIGLAGNLLGEEGGIGLSGLIYFQFGFLIVLASSDRRAARVCDRTTRWLLWSGLLLLGPLLSYTGTVKVGNVVHVGGCLVGLAAGLLSLQRARPWRRPVAAAIAAVLACATLLVVNPFWRGDWHYWKAYYGDEYRTQLHHYRASLRIDPGNPRTLFNLGLAHFQQGELADAERVWLRCVARDPDNPAVSKALFSLYAKRGDAAGMERWAQRLESFSARL